MDLNSVFSGIGTSVVSFLLGCLGGGFVGYRVGVSKEIKQSQKAGDDSCQVQVGESRNG